ncbi:putative bir1 protein [Plasmodium yoelii yoelii]|nr:putative bir1 protein [Plasmodium yoelii yoelii]
MSKFYELLKLLCNMSTDNMRGNSTQLSDHANKFVNEYEKLLNDNANIVGNSYNKVLNVFSKYYDNFGKDTDFHNTLMKRIPLPTKKNSIKVDIAGSNGTKIDGLSDEISTSISEPEVSDIDSTSSSSSILNKLISIPFIFFVTLVLLGIGYKYSLFGFRKRSQKHLREKLKK